MRNFFNNLLGILGFNWQTSAILIILSIISGCFSGINSVGAGSFAASLKVLLLAGHAPAIIMLIITAVAAVVLFICLVIGFWNWITIDILKRNKSKSQYHD
jgi:hypothetical protein